MSQEITRAQKEYSNIYNNTFYYTRLREKKLLGGSSLYNIICLYIHSYFLGFRNNLKINRYFKYFICRKSKTITSNSPFFSCAYHKGVINNSVFIIITFK
jgi:predicted membrane protein